MMNRPHVQHDPRLIAEMKPPVLSIDYEFSIRTGQPSILGISDATNTVCVPHDEGHPYLLELLDKHPDAKWLGHHFCGAEHVIWRKLGITIKPEQIIDTILIHYLLNMNLCKQQKASNDEDEVAGRGRGWMNLYAMCSLYTDAPNWKYCIGEDQCLEESRPCPDHTPLKYCGNDTYWPLQAYPKMWSTAKMRGVDKLYPLHRDLMLVLQRVKERGMLVDVGYVNTLRGDFEDARAELRAGFEFNPDSPKQVVEYFKKKGIALPSAQEQEIRDAVEEHEDVELESLLEFKELGKGPDRWFAPRSFEYDKGNYEGYVDDDGYVHGDIGIFTSSGRCNHKNPNLGNVARRRKDRKTGESLGKKIRRALIAPEGQYFVRSDYKNAENVGFLTLAGYEELPETDFHSYMRDMIGIKEDDPFAMALGGAREAAKSVTHATDYFEGLKLLTKEDLRRPNIQREVSFGARLVFPDWMVFGKYVTFTGINLARRAFGEASLVNRKRALDIQVKYFNGFPKLRDLQKRIMSQVDRDRAIRLPTGYVIPSYGPEEDRLKTAAACWGSNPIAQFVKHAMIRADGHPRLTNVLSVHDELIFYVSKEYSPQQIKKDVEDVMCFALPEIPNMRLRVDVGIGANWADTREIV